MFEKISKRYVIPSLEKASLPPNERKSDGILTPRIYARKVAEILRENLDENVRVKNNDKGQWFVHWILPPKSKNDDHQIVEVMKWAHEQARMALGNHLFALESAIGHVPFTQLHVFIPEKRSKKRYYSTASIGIMFQAIGKTPPEFHFKPVDKRKNKIKKGR